MGFSKSNDDTSILLLLANLPKPGYPWLLPLSYGDFLQDNTNVLCVGVCVCVCVYLF